MSSWSKRNLQDPTPRSRLRWSTAVALIGLIPVLATVVHPQPAAAAPEGRTGCTVIATRGVADLVSIPADGSAEPTVLATRRGQYYGIRDVTVVDDSAYFTESTFGEDRSYIMAVPTAGGDTRTLTFAVALPDGITHVDEMLYFTDVRGTNIRRVPTSGGTPTDVADLGGSPRRLAASPATLFAADRQSTVWSMPVTGGPATNFYTGPSPVYAVAVGGDRLYVAGGSTPNTIVSLPVGGGEPTDIPLDNLEPRSLAAGAHTLYIGTTTGIYAMDLNTRAVRTITTGADYSGGIALESDTLPFGSGSAGWNFADSGSATLGLPNQQC